MKITTSTEHFHTIEVSAPEGKPFILTGNDNKPQVEVEKIALVLSTLGTDSALRTTMMNAHGRPLGPDGTPIPAPSPKDFFKTRPRFDNAVNSCTLDRLPDEIVDQVVEVADRLGVAGLRERIADHKARAAE